jgi:hypothetical protein
MGLIEWYIKIYKRIDPSMHHPSIWGRSKAEFKALSSRERDNLAESWRRYNSIKEEKEKKEQEVAVENSRSPLIFEGKEIPSDLRMDEIQEFLNLPKRERERQLKALRDGAKEPSILPSQSYEQLSLFGNPKISVLIRTLKKVSNAR